MCVSGVAVIRVLLCMCIVGVAVLRVVYVRAMVVAILIVVP